MNFPGPVRSRIWLLHLAPLLASLCLAGACRHPQAGSQLFDSSRGALLSREEGNESATAEGAPAFEVILKIDVHAHIFEEIPQLSEMMKRNNVRAINVCNRGRDGHLEAMHRIARELYEAHPNLFPFASCFDLTRMEEAGYAKVVILWLDGTLKNGGVIIKILSKVGMVEW